MFPSNSTKFFLLFTLAAALFSSCRFWQKTSDVNPPSTPPVAAELKSEIPFSTKEPERFQAEIVVTANDAERRTFLARSGTNRRFDFNFGEKNQLTTLSTDKNYLILPARRIYTENDAAEAGASDDWANFLTTRWLNEKTAARFEKLETVDNLTKYRVNLGDGGASEIFVYADENLGLPVRQEFYTVVGEQKKLTYLFELKNLKLDAGEQLFALPANFKKVSAEEFRKNLRSE